MNLENLWKAQDPSTLAAMGTTVVAGGYGVTQIVKGGHEYANGDFKEGSKSFFRGNVGLTASAIANETILNGHPGAYTLAELPFLISGIREWIVNNQIGNSKLQEWARKYGVPHALAVNFIVHAPLIAMADEPLALSDYLRHIGFTGLSTSFVMPTEGAAYLKREWSALQERFVATLSTRSFLLTALGIDIVKSFKRVLETDNLAELNVLAIIWMFLNAYGFRGDIKNVITSFKKEE